MIPTLPVRCPYASPPNLETPSLRAADDAAIAENSAKPSTLVSYLARRSERLVSLA